MNGYTKGARNEIFALRPAPIQVRLKSEIEIAKRSFTNFFDFKTILFFPGHVARLPWYFWSFFYGLFNNRCRHVSFRTGPSVQ